MEGENLTLLVGQVRYCSFDDIQDEDLVDCETKYSFVELKAQFWDYFLGLLQVAVEDTCGGFSSCSTFCDQQLQICVQTSLSEDDVFSKSSLLKQFSTSIEIQHSRTNTERKRC